VAHELALDPQAMTLDITAGGRDLLVTVTAPSMALMSWYLLERLAGVPHIARVQSHLIIRTYTEASRWRLRSLDRHQVRRLEPRTAPGRGSHQAVRDRDWAIAHTLSLDGRASTTTLAAAASASVSTARRRLNSLLDSGHLRLRCELARTLSGWPVSAWLFTRVPPDRLDQTARTLATLPEVRTVLSTAGPSNLLIAVWLRTMTDAQELEIQLSRKLPQIDIVDRSIVVRAHKLVGRLLDENGFALSAVSLDTRHERS
jgi:DNA-binding Lrp family transcriptional regulator